MPSMCIDSRHRCQHRCRRINTSAMHASLAASIPTSMTCRHPCLLMPRLESMLALVPDPMPHQRMRRRQWPSCLYVVFICRAYVISQACSCRATFPPILPRLRARQWLWSAPASTCWCRYACHVGGESQSVTPAVASSARGRKSTQRTQHHHKRKQTLSVPPHFTALTPNPYHDP